MCRICATEVKCKIVKCIMHTSKNMHGIKRAGECVEKVSKSLKLDSEISRIDGNCIVCKKLPPKDVFQCTQGDIFCGDCWIKAAEAPKCPKCDVDLKQAIRNIYAEQANALLLLTLTCSIESCGAVFGTADALKQHIDQGCPKRLVTCRFVLFGCTPRFPADTVAEHESKCEFRVPRLIYNRMINSVYISDMTMRFFQLQGGAVQTMHLKLQRVLEGPLFSVRCIFFRQAISVFSYRYRVTIEFHGAPTYTALTIEPEQGNHIPLDFFITPVETSDFQFYPRFHLAKEVQSGYRRFRYSTANGGFGNSLNLSIMRRSAFDRICHPDTLCVEFLFVVRKADVVQYVK